MSGFFTRDKSRLVQLDFIRGAAIVMVMFRHMPVRPPKAGFLTPVAEELLRFGWAGVDLFFVLSGFLVGGLLFKELQKRSSLSAGRFLLRRMFKIWPVYFVYMAFVAVMIYEGHRYFYAPAEAFRSAMKLIWPNLLHIQNYFDPPRAHTWSLAVEEHFYLVLPLVLYLSTFRKKGEIKSIRAVPVMAAVLVVVCAAMRIYLNYTPPFGKNVVYPTHLRMDGLFFGVALSYLCHFNGGFAAMARKMRLLLVMFGFVLISPIFVIELETPFMRSVGFTMVYAGFGLIILGAYFSPADSGLSGRFFRNPLVRAVAFIGFYSYSIYLWHFEIFLLLLDSLKNTPVNALTGAGLWMGAYIVYFVFSFAIGIIVGSLIEMPFLKLRDRLFPSLAKPAKQGRQG